MIELVKTSGHVLMSVRANWIPGSMYFNMTSCNGYEFQSTLIAMEALVGDTTLHYTALREEAYSITRNLSSICWDICCFKML